MKFVAGKYHVDSRPASRQRHQLRLELQIHQAVEIQPRVCELQERKHRVVASKAAVRGEVKKPRLRSMPEQALFVRVRACQPDRVRIDSTEHSQLLAYPLSMLVGHAQGNQLPASLAARPGPAQS